jgi:hypothetical protein
VVVVEGRSRAGGRVHSSRLEQLAFSGVGELGGSVLTGVDGNPLAVIARQLGESMHTIGMRCVVPAKWGVCIVPNSSSLLHHHPFISGARCTWQTAYLCRRTSTRRCAATLLARATRSRSEC